MYEAFLAKGSNVELPANTPILLRIHEKAHSSSLGEGTVRSISGTEPGAINGND
jgi:hypothetical protein